MRTLQSDAFAGLDAAKLQRSYESFGSAIAQAIALSSVSLSRDDTMPPQEFAAGLVKAHLAGLASAILATTRLTGQDAGALAEAVAASLGEQVAIGLRAQP